MTSLYQDQLLDHYRNPRNFGSLPQATAEGSAENKSCGDSLHMDIAVEHDKIKDIRFSGSGCAISQASASLLTEKVRGMSVSRAQRLTPKEVVGLLGVPLSPIRIKCGLLSLETLKKALRN